MNTSGKWTRRQFSGALAVTAASTLLARPAWALAAPQRSHFAFLGFAEGTVSVCSVVGDTFHELHVVQAASPAHLVMHPAHSVLYVVHDVDQWEHRPRGAVSAYRFNTAAEGRLSLLGTQPLSLSATSPRHAALTGSGDALFVAASGGGIFNVLPIAADGGLQPVTAIRKELGRDEDGQAKTAAPERVALHRDGSLYASDPGQGTISQFAISRSSITLLRRSRVHPANGASGLAMPEAPNEAYSYPMTADLRTMLQHTA